MVRAAMRDPATTPLRAATGRLLLRLLDTADRAVIRPRLLRIPAMVLHRPRMGKAVPAGEAPISNRRPRQQPAHGTVTRNLLPRMTSGRALAHRPPVLRRIRMRPPRRARPMR